MASLYAMFSACMGPQNITTIYIPDGGSTLRSSRSITLRLDFIDGEHDELHPHPHIMPSSALPLNVATPSKTDADKDKNASLSAKKPNLAKPSALTAGEISSPHELTAFVEGLLEQLDVKFDDMSSQILDRMSQMSTRIDALEASIHDIINGDVSVPQSPPAPGTPSVRKD